MAATTEQRAEPAAAVGALPPGARPDAFVSYARKDSDFVRDQLLPALPGKEVWIDLERIPPGAEWLERIYVGIEAAGAVVFVLSPHWVASNVCKQELARAEAHNKRIVPVLVKDTEPELIPEGLERRNWIHWRPGDDAAAARAKLLEAIEQDHTWREQHARLAVRASEWLANRRDNSYLLRGSDLRGFETWLDEAEKHSEQPTETQRDYVFKSRRAATRRSRTTLAAVCLALAVALALAAFALIQRETRSIARARRARRRWPRARSRSCPPTPSSAYFWRSRATGSRRPRRVGTHCAVPSARRSCALASSTRVP